MNVSYDLESKGEESHRTQSFAENVRTWDVLA